jgi:inhibitor of cysteine peptidase
MAAFGILSTSLSIPHISFAAEPEVPFLDVYDDHEYLNSIQYLKENDIVEGYEIEGSTEREFRADYQLNRAELVKIMVEAQYTEQEINDCWEEKNLKEWKTMHFPDVKMTDWFAKYVCIAVEKGILDGYPDGTFKPSEPVNFVEAAKIISNAVALKSNTQSGDDWFTPFVRALAERKGIPTSIRSFPKSITRGEMARMIHAAKENVSDDTLELSKLEEFDKRELDLPQIASCDALIDKLGLNDEEYYGFKQPRMMEFDGDMMMMEESVGSTRGGEGASSNEAERVTAPLAVSSQAKDEKSAVSDDFSQTNVQVKGVDEADIVKNDGKYIYLIKGSSIRIVEAFPAEGLKELSSIEVDDEDFNPTEMYIDEDQMVIIGQVYRERHYNRRFPVEPFTTDSREIAPTSMIWPGPSFNQNRMKVYVYDISDKANPKKQRSIEIEGDYSNSRKVGKNVYFVINQWIPHYRVLENESADVIIPRFKDSAQGDIERPLTRCMGIQYFPGFQDRNYLIVAGLDISDNSSRLNRKVLLGSSQNIYSSRENLYVATPHYGETYTEDEEDSFYESESMTRVYRFALNEDEIEYQNQGIVPGNILNQFSMDEARGHFRIATTRDRYNSREGSVRDNNLYVLDQDNMKVVGAVEEIAPGESIKSVRFVGNRAYMVTFKNVDPLFVIDLRNNQNPKILGKLKIPGWSDYLHPYDENHLIGFGREVDPRAENADRLTSDFLLGMKISIFDVSDVKNPKETHKEVIGARGTTSELLTNHKAILFDKDKNLLAFPINITQDRLRKDCLEFRHDNCPKGCDNVFSSETDDIADIELKCLNPLPEYGDIQTIFSGGIIYDINLEDGFTLKGKVTHYEDDSVFEDSGEYFYGDLGRTIQRMLYIGKYLYSVSPDFVRGYDLETVKSLNFIKLSGPQSDDVDYIKERIF